MLFDYCKEDAILFGMELGIAGLVPFFGSKNDARAAASLLVDGIANPATIL